MAATSWVAFAGPRPRIFSATSRRRGTGRSAFLFVDDTPGEIDNVLAADAGAKDDGDQFGFAEAPGPWSIMRSRGRSSCASSRMVR
jgi:hypothetical protein